MMVKVVYDTNVVVSAALKPGNLPASLVALAIAKKVKLFLSPAILKEYTDVLKRPKFGLAPATIEAFLCDLRKAGVSVRPSRRVSRAPDEPDNRFLECASAARADYLVTGNKKHFPFPECEVKGDVRSKATSLTGALRRSRKVHDTRSEPRA
ncbi:MAG: putative toxin-antitoxin system toxin component, PIN family [candidate division NC10 bacterium]|nr:putative toxin-antitoxin system toxin component, PIN family [candidate division NC10 bacterium]MBI2454975.1 putative toxin-antitoxin system toxin component, PIN family [candidate division NC10 bacterium]